jgi:myo-inositol-1(or 4)-monophosphatase
MPFDRELEVTLEAAREAGEILLRHYHGETKTWEKSKDNPVTLADLESDRAIAERLRAAFPEDAILSEETVSDPSRTRMRRIWIVDPMDGTKEFTRKIPEFSVSIALCVDGEPAAAVVLNPMAETTIWATRGGGTFRDGEPARVSSCERLEDAVMIASRTEISRDKFAPYADWFKELRPVGSIAWKLACVACGDGDLNVTFAPKNEWDVCAGDLLVCEAGGVFTDFDGARRRYNQDDPLIAAGMGAGPKALLEDFFARARKPEAGTG